MRSNITRWFHQMGIAISIAGMIALSPSRAFASEEVIFTYGGLRQSVSLEELQNFAQTGERSPSIDFLLNFSKQNPSLMRWILKQEFPANIKLISDLLNTAPGEYALSQTSSVVSSKSQRADVTALRGALISAASDDNSISLIELLESYPTQQVYINGRILARVRQNLGQFIQDNRYIETSLGILID